MKFQHFIRSQKRQPDSNLRDRGMQWGLLDMRRQ
jgi:catalase